MSEFTKGMKLLLSYNVNPESGQKYYEFVLGHYIPAMQALGLEISEAWHTAYGEYPARMVAFIARDKQTMRELVVSDDWEELNDQLLEHVIDFSYKIVPYR